MGRIAIACYKPKAGKEKELDQLVQTHLGILRKEGLATDRASIAMKAEDGTVVEVFEWKSKAAIDAAHANPIVQQMWAAFSEVCDFLSPADVPEFQQMFSEFEAIAV